MSPEDVQAAVQQLLPEIEVTGRPAALTGGLMNFVWRVPASPRNVIVKHARPYIATAPDVPLDVSRITFEARCLALLGAGGRLNHVSSSTVRPPELLAFDAQASLLLMEDVGAALSFDQWLLETADPEALAEKLGSFIGGLHRETAGDGQLQRTVNNLPIQQTRDVVQYQAVGRLIKTAGRPDARIAAEKARALGARLVQPGRCLIMGDLWPSSILVNAGELCIIDWEFAHYGNPAQDVAHLSAHLWMLAHRHPEKKEAVRKAMQVFLAAYEEALYDQREVLWDIQVCEDAAVHFGAEVLVRTVGAFQSGYLYDGLLADAPAVQEAVAFALAAMEMPVEDEILPFLL